MSSTKQLNKRGTKRNATDLLSTTDIQNDDTTNPHCSKRQKTKNVTEKSAIPSKSEKTEHSTSTHVNQETSTANKIHGYLVQIDSSGIHQTPFILTKPTIKIGRKKDNDIILTKYNTISSNHAEIEINIARQEAFIIDLQSTNKTRIGYQLPTLTHKNKSIKPNRECMINSGIYITFGNVNFIFYHTQDYKKRIVLGNTQPNTFQSSHVESSDDSDTDTNSHTNDTQPNRIHNHPTHIHASYSQNMIANCNTPQPNSSIQYVPVYVQPPQQYYIRPLNEQQYNINARLPETEPKAQQNSTFGSCYSYLIVICKIILLLTVVPVVLYAMSGHSKPFDPQCMSLDSFKNDYLKCAEISMQFVVSYYDGIFTHDLKLWYEENKQFATIWVMCAICAGVTLIDRIQINIMFVLIGSVMIDVFSEQLLFTFLCQGLNDGYKASLFEAYYRFETTVHIAIGSYICLYVGNKSLKWMWWFVFFATLSYLTSENEHIKTFICFMGLLCVDGKRNLKNSAFRTIFYYALLILPLVMNSKARQQYKSLTMVQGWIGELFNDGVERWLKRKIYTLGFEKIFFG